MKSIDDIALAAAKRADSIGCCFSTQRGEMPTRDEIDDELTERVGKVRTSQNAQDRQIAIHDLTAWALLAAVLTDVKNG